MHIDNPDNVPVTLFAKPELSIERDAIEQLLGFVALEGTLRALESAERAGTIAPFCGETAGRLNAVVLTPDFHRGGGIPVGTVAEAEGFVVPQAVGNDVCCGMRLVATEVRPDEIAPHLDRLMATLRSIFFAGQRDIRRSERSPGAKARGARCRQDSRVFASAAPKATASAVLRVRSNG